MPRPLQVVTAAVAIVVAIAPLVVAPTVADSVGMDRSTGSTLGALITVALFVTIGAVSREVIRRKAERPFGSELNEAFRPYRDDRPNNQQ